MALWLLDYWTIGPAIRALTALFRCSGRATIPDKGIVVLPEAVLILMVTARSILPDCAFTVVFASDQEPWADQLTS